MRLLRSTAALAVALPFALGQTSTDCNPTQNSCPSDNGLNSGAFASDFTQGSGSNASWSAARGTTITYGSQGAEFIISQAGQAPTIQTDFYIFFGRIDVKMKAASGTGIVSSIVLESDDLDEIDWEFLGGNTAQVETNFFGKGNTTAYDRAIYYPVSTPQNDFHTYTVDWTSDRIEFIVDGTTVRTLAYTDPLTVGGTNYPQTPMRLKLGSWCGGCAGVAEGTVEWAGGNTTFEGAPYIMYVESVAIQNYNPAGSYEYGDLTGSWQSIKIPNSTSDSAPTSSQSVFGVSQSGAVVATTVTGASYSVNAASASAQNANGTMSTSFVSATTEVPGSSPSTGASTTRASATSSSGPSSQTGTSAASANNVLAAGSLLSVALGFFML
ncbi:glycoside hydrolase family 16 protein [Baudoinia panamericana UAMH 10762]|uniref:Crh-like protein n=1 Tax=Baudoinia panamericana (strain UAMH 10762) TaxID=717646 RepID=M2MA65_BAUPA|nr:glycoside hydrolase family 16 protein [Baudoinia panamericana UAMH 10762]EMC93366.1 glycoside hydrolase family 16 protein [Baudoinia panamericana UAMH 10762]